MFPDASPVLRDFLNYTLVIKGKSEGTVNEYFYDLRTFFRFLKVNKKIMDLPKDFEQITINDIDAEFLKTVGLGDLYEYLSFVNKYRNNGSATRARKVASLKSFFKYAVNKAGILSDNPAKDLDSPKLKRSQPVYLTLDESKKLLISASGALKERDLCILTLFLNCGMRLSELIGINVSDIREDTIRILGKGNKERTVYLTKACIIAIDNYLRVRPNDGLDAKSRDALLISKQKKRISERMVQTIVKKYIELSGLDPAKYSPHKLRHTAATLLYKYGEVDIRILQEILGHENLSTTQIYTHLDEKQLKDAVNKHPLG